MGRALTGPACQRDPDAWFALDAPTIRAAMRACRRCPVQAACADMGEDERFGVWGGIPRDPEQDKALDREARAIARARVRRAS